MTCYLSPFFFHACLMSDIFFFREQPKHSHPKFSYQSELRRKYFLFLKYSSHHIYNVSFPSTVLTPKFHFCRTLHKVSNWLGHWRGYTKHVLGANFISNIRDSFKEIHLDGEDILVIQNLILKIWSLEVDSWHRLISIITLTYCH